MTITMTARLFISQLGELMPVGTVGIANLSDAFVDDEGVVIVACIIEGCVGDGIAVGRVVMVLFAMFAWWSSSPSVMVNMSFPIRLSMLVSLTVVVTKGRKGECTYRRLKQWIIVLVGRKKFCFMIVGTVGI